MRMLALGFLRSCLMEDRIDRRGLRRACTLKRRHEALSSALVSEEDEREEVGPRSSDEGLGKVHRVSRVTAEFDVGGVRKSLLDWYVRERRDLPWRAEPFSEWETRKEKDPGAPYVVWVSEIMLQQTKVATVVDYFYRWMEVFPTVEALAAADLEKVNEVWAGLGYYRRAKMLHAGAKMVMEKYDGKLPCTVKELLTIPGIGHYTAGAIASIAFNQPEALVDGNVARVLSRCRAVLKEPADKVFWELAREVLDIEAPGDFNQSLMELGATVCTPKNPSCGRCPLQMHCIAKMEADALGISSDEYVIKYPQKAAKTKQRSDFVSVCVLENDGKFLLVKRPETGLLPGLWEFPTTEAKDAHNRVSEEESLRQLLSNFNHPINGAKMKYLGEIVHIFTHIRQTLRVYKVSRKGEGQRNGGRNDSRESQGSAKQQWLAPADVEHCAISTQMQKVLKKASNGGGRKGSIEQFFK